MSGRGNPALGEAGSAGGDLECPEGVTRVVGPTDLGGEHEADLLAGRAGPTSLVVLCGSKVANHSLRGAGIGRSAGPRRLRLGDQQPSLDLASVPRPAVPGVGRLWWVRLPAPGVRTRRARRTRRIGAIVRTAGGRGRHRLPRGDALRPISSRARHTQCPPGRIVWKITPGACPTSRPLVPSSEAGLG